MAVTLTEARPAGHVVIAASDSSSARKSAKKRLVSAGVKGADVGKHLYSIKYRKGAQQRHIQCVVDPSCRLWCKPNNPLSSGVTVSLTWS